MERKESRDHAADKASGAYQDLLDLLAQKEMSKYHLISTIINDSFPGVKLACLDLERYELALNQMTEWDIPDQVTIDNNCQHHVNASVQQYSNFNAITT